MSINWLDWPAPKNVKACFTEREGGSSLAPFHSFNLALHVGDEEEVVIKNRQCLSGMINHHPVHWLNQVHSTRVINVDQSYLYEADASFSRRIAQVCCIMTADCLPIFLCDEQGQQVAVVHAGWRGLCCGVLHNTVNTFVDNPTLIAYLGPAISQSAFEVGNEVKMAFINRYPHLGLKKYFIASDLENKWMGDLYGIAREMLKALKVNSIYGGDRCTFSEKNRFFSFRREGITGRMANLIWLE